MSNIEEIILSGKWGNNVSYDHLMKCHESAIESAKYLLHPRSSDDKFATLEEFEEIYKKLFRLFANAVSGVFLED